jgi:hypothetical protein
LSGAPVLAVARRRAADNRKNSDFGRTAGGCSPAPSGSPRGPFLEPLRILPPRSVQQTAGTYSVFVGRSPSHRIPDDGRQFPTLPTRLRGSVESPEPSFVRKKAQTVAKRQNLEIWRHLAVESAAVDGRIVHGLGGQPCRRRCKKVRPRGQSTTSDWKPNTTGVEAIRRCKVRSSNDDPMVLNSVNFHFSFIYRVSPLCLYDSLAGFTS